MNSSNDYDVAVVGLGPVGGVLCNLLALQGLRVVAFDREPGVLQLPRGVGIDGEIMRVVQTIGLAEELEPRLKVFRGAQYLDVNGNVVATRPGITGPGPQGWPNRYNVHQPDFEEVVRSGLTDRPNVDLRLSHEVREVRSEEDAGIVVAENRQTGERFSVRSRYIVGCDGARSLVRRTAKLVLDDFGLNEPWLVVDFKINSRANLPDINTHYAHPEQPVIYVHVVRDLRRFEFKLRPDEDLDKATDSDVIWQRVSRWLKPDQAELVRAAVYTHRSLVARTWRVGRFIVAGDAAHQTPPFLGQGLCAGVRDAAALAWRLGAVIQQGASESLLDTYGDERGEHARFYIKTATTFGTVLTSPDRNTIEELNLRVGREGRGKPPRLGPGMFKMDAVGGRLAPQPRLASGELLDDVVGYRFGVIVNSEIRQQLSADFVDAIEKVGFTTVEASGGAAEWLRELDAQAVVVRPDRYYYGAFSDAATLEAELRSLASQLAPAAVLD